MIRLPLMEPIFLLRWRFEFNDGTKPLYGQWMKATQDEIRNMASFQKQRKLARAFIEVKDKRTGKISFPMHCVGEDYCLFKWNALARLGGGPNAVKGSRTLPTEVVGLTLVTREIEATFFVDGKMKIVKRTEQDKDYHYESFGNKGVL